MSDRSMGDRYQDAGYKAMVEAYRQRHKHDAEKEPEPETDIQRMSRYMGVRPGDGNVSRRRDSDDDRLRRMIGID